MKKRKGKGAGRIISNIILVIAVLVFLYSAYQLYTIFAEYNEGEEEYESISEQVIIIEQAPKDEEETDTVFQVDFEKLHAINKDVVGWIRFDEPAQISYPVAQGDSNDEYLRTTLEGKRNTAGTIFVDYRHEGDFSDWNTFIYGHNMRNGTMFGQLKKYRDADFYEKYPYFYIYKPDGSMLTYQIFAVCVVLDTSDTYEMVYDTEGYQEYIKRAKVGALYQTDVEVPADSRIVTLSTCTNDSEEERLVVHAVLVNETVAEE